MVGNQWGRESLGETNGGNQWGRESLAGVPFAVKTLGPLAGHRPAQNPYHQVAPHQQPSRKRASISSYFAGGLTLLDGERMLTPA